MFRSLQIDTKKKILVSHINAYQRMTSAEKDFNNRVDRMTCSVNYHRLLSLATPVTPNGLMIKVAMAAVMEVMKGPNIDSHPPK